MKSKLIVTFLFGIFLAFASMPIQAQEKPTNPVLLMIFDEIGETIKIVDEFDPKTRRWTARDEWIWRAVSPSDRESWAKNFFDGFEDQKGIFYKELDRLAASYAKKVKLLNPSDALFANHNAAEEALMKKQVAANVKVHKIGIEYANWEVQKNNLDIPQKRFKRAYIWGDPADDSKYCRLYQVNLIQEYEGGGKYGATYAKYLDSWPRSCLGK